MPRFEKTLYPQGRDHTNLTGGSFFSSYNCNASRRRRVNKILRQRVLRGLGSVLVQSSFIFAETEQGMLSVDLGISKQQESVVNRKGQATQRAPRWMLLRGRQRSLPSACLKRQSGHFWPRKLTLSDNDFWSGYSWPLMQEASWRLRLDAQRQHCLERPRSHAWHTSAATLYNKNTYRMPSSVKEM